MHWRGNTGGYERTMDFNERGTATGVRHPWEKHRFKFYHDVIVSSFGRRPLSVLDVGAGDGWFARELRSVWEAPLDITLWDSGYGEGDAKEDGIPRIAGNPDRSFDLVLMLDVAEHVTDDAGFLASIIRRNLEPGGRILFSVPAWTWLWSSHDMRLRHVRRYSPRVARALLEGAGLRVLESGGLFPILLPIRVLQITREKVMKVPVPGLEGAPRGVMTMLVNGVLALDRKVARGASRVGIQVPGLSWWALCAR